MEGGRGQDTLSNRRSPSAFQNVGSGSLPSDGRSRSTCWGASARRGTPGTPGRGRLRRPPPAAAPARAPTATAGCHKLLAGLRAAATPSSAGAALSSLAAAEVVDAGAPGPPGPMHSVRLRGRPRKLHQCRLRLRWLHPRPRPTSRGSSRHHGLLPTKRPCNDHSHDSHVWSTSRYRVHCGVAILQAPPARSPMPTLAQLHLRP
mmetsp:Transcript_33334/g.92113  ORF Transcript_33334/g.92113 Transcript_33334/m.92113 type:complete len:204 (-) Transcript_33334:32-643(-)